MKDNASAFNVSNYDEKIKMTLPYYEDFYNQVIDVVKIQFDKPLRWLDVGCGTGKMAEAAFNNVNIDRFVFYDNSKQMIETAQKRFRNKNADFIALSAQELDKSEEFDIATAIQVFHYLQREERTEAVRKCYNALRTNGMFITFENFAPFSECGKALFLNRWREYQLSQGKSAGECDNHINRYGKDYFPISISEHLEVLNNCGFKGVEILWVSNMQVGLLGIK